MYVQDAAGQNTVIGCCPPVSRLTEKLCCSPKTLVFELVNELAGLQWVKLGALALVSIDVVIVQEVFLVQCQKHIMPFLLRVSMLIRHLMFIVIMLIKIIIERSIITITLYVGDMEGCANSCHAACRARSSAPRCANVHDRRRGFDLHLRRIFKVTSKKQNNSNNTS